MKIEFNNKELEKIKPLVVWVTGCLARCDECGKTYISQKLAVVEPRFFRLGS